MVVGQHRAKRVEDIAYDCGAAVYIHLTIVPVEAIVPNVIWCSYIDPRRSAQEGMPYQGFNRLMGLSTSEVVVNSRNVATAANAICFNSIAVDLDCDDSVIVRVTRCFHLRGLQIVGGASVHSGAWGGRRFESQRLMRAVSLCIVALQRLNVVRAEESSPLSALRGDSKTAVGGENCKLAHIVRVVITASRSIRTRDGRRQDNRVLTSHLADISDSESCCRALLRRKGAEVLIWSE